MTSRVNTIGAGVNARVNAQGEYRPGFGAGSNQRQASGQLHSPGPGTYNSRLGAQQLDHNPGCSFTRSVAHDEPEYNKKGEAKARHIGAGHARLHKGTEVSRWPEPLSFSFRPLGCVKQILLSEMPQPPSHLPPCFGCARCSSFLHALFPPFLLPRPKTTTVMYLLGSHRKLSPWRCTLPWQQKRPRLRQRRGERFTWCRRLRPLPGPVRVRP